MSQRMISAIRAEVVLSDTRQGNAIVITEFQKVLIRLLVPAEHQTWNLAGCELIVHPALLFLVHGINICLLHVSDDLNPLPVKMIKRIP